MAVVKDGILTVLSSTFLFTVLSVTRKWACSWQTPLSTETNITGTLHVTIVTLLIACLRWARDCSAFRTCGGLVTFIVALVTVCYATVTWLVVAMLNTSAWDYHLASISRHCFFRRKNCNHDQNMTEHLEDCKGKKKVYALTYNVETIETVMIAHLKGFNQHDYHWTN